MRINNIYKTLAIMAGLFSGVSQTASAGSLTQTIIFNATFYGGNCEITAPSKVIYNSGNPIQDDTIIGDKIYQQFDVKLTNCDGYFMTPKISVSGNTITTSDNVKLFADASSTTTGYGIRLATDGNDQFEANNNTAVNSIIRPKNWPAVGNDSSVLNGALQFKGYLSCGACTPSSDLLGGDLNATVTFTFLYN